MSPSRPLFIGMEVHKDAIAGAYVPPGHGAEVTSLGAIGTRQGDRAQRMRTRPSNANPPPLRL